MTALDTQCADQLISRYTRSLCRLTHNEIFSITASIDFLTLHEISASIDVYREILDRLTCIEIFNQCAGIADSELLADITISGSTDIEALVHCMRRSTYLISDLLRR